MPRSSVIIPIVAGIGNALMAVPMVRQIKRSRPELKVTIIARLSAMAEPFRRLREKAEVDEVLVNGTGAGGQIRGLLWTRSRKPGVYLIPFPSNRWQYSLLAAASGARHKLVHGYPVGYFRALHFATSDRVPADRGIHDVVQNLRLLRSLNITPDETEPPRFLLNDDDRTHAAAMLSNAGVAEDVPFIAVHAGSARTILAQAKRWPAENYAGLCAMIASRFERKVVLLEGPDEAGVADEIFRHITGGDRPHVLKLSGPLGDAAAVLERASLYVGSDSGLGHLAAAVGTAPVTIFAPADPERVCPFGYRHLVVQPSKACSPCFMYPWQTPYPKMKCASPMCVTEITVDAVAAAMARALDW